MSQRSVEGIFKNIQYWPPSEVNSLQFQQEQQGKARVMKPYVKSFLGFSQKILGNKTEIFIYLFIYLLLSVLTLTLSSLSSTDGGWEVAGLT